MIRERQTTINCDVCHDVVAIKRYFRFHTVRDFVTLSGDEVGIIENNTPVDIHICAHCWGRMRDVVRNAIKKEG